MSPELVLVTVCTSIIKLSLWFEPTKYVWFKCFLSWFSIRCSYVHHNSLQKVIPDSVYTRYSSEWRVMKSLTTIKYTIIIMSGLKLSLSQKVQVQIYPSSYYAESAESVMPL